MNPVFRAVSKKLQNSWKTIDVVNSPLIKNVDSKSSVYMLLMNLFGVIFCILTSSSHLHQTYFISCTKVSLKIISCSGVLTWLGL